MGTDVVATDTETRARDLRARLEKKALALTVECIDSHLRSKGEPFFDGCTEYDSTQRYLARDEVELPSQVKILYEVLSNIRATSRSKASNVDNNDFPVYHFLSGLLSQHRGNSSVLDHLVMTYDDEYPTFRADSLDENSAYEGMEIYRGVKTHAVAMLLEAFLNRGLVAPFPANHDPESLSQSMTESRYYYLAYVAECFSKNHESKAVIDFIKQLPSNQWFDHTIRLQCDKPGEFRELERKYLRKGGEFKDFQETR